MLYIAYFDGACLARNPTERLGAGLVIYKGEKKLVERSWRPFDDQSNLTNNMAEYAALLEAFDWFIDHELIDAPIIIRGDSQLVIYQLWPDPRFGRRWDIKKSRSSYLAREARSKLLAFDHCTGEWIRREQNKEADRLSKQALRDRWDSLE